MTVSITHGASALVTLLARIDGAWAGEVYSADGALLGRQQVSCAWDADQTTLRLRSCLLSPAGRVLDAEELQLLVDPAANMIAALLRQSGRGAEPIRVYAGGSDEVVLFYDSALQLRRLILPLLDAATPAGDAWTYGVKGVQEAWSATEIRVELRRVAWLARGAAQSSHQEPFSLVS